LKTKVTIPKVTIPKVTILGCGTSSGVPFLFCRCRVCLSRNPKNKRLRTSAWIKYRGKHILIDASTDLRQQALRAKIPRLDAVLITHPHADHIGGLDELRSFNYIQKETIPLFGNTWTTTDLKKRFDYIFGDNQAPEGGGIPMLKLHTLHDEPETIELFKDVKVTLLPVKHGSKNCLGFRFDDFAYITDTSEIPPTTLNNLQNLKSLVLDCVRISPHRTHLNLERALQVIDAVKPKRTYLTHLNHDFDYTKMSKKLPKNVFLAYDGLTF
jgi:phosphoribosyl 1,2-cyclic phosphate phosphodiesterase